MNIIGVDCATNPKKVGVAMGKFIDGKCELLSAQQGTTWSSLVQQINVCLPCEGSALLALDAPLGWPDTLGKVLAKHVAGCVIEEEPNIMFRRMTDRFIESKIGKRPFDVGADRIARTARAALELLSKVRKESGHRIPLAWNPGKQEEVVAIEVYPAATLTAYGLPNTRYKDRKDVQQRKKIIDGLSEHMQLPTDTQSMEDSDHVLDAAVCVLAGKDFLISTAIPPENNIMAEKEGWIWVRPLCKKS